MKTLEKQAPIWRGGKRLVRKQGGGGETEGGGLSNESRHLRAPSGSGGAHGRMTSGREGRSQGQTPAACLPAPCTAPPHLGVFPVLHGGPGGGEQRGAVRAWKRWGWGSCRHTPAETSSPRPPLSRGCLLVPQAWDSPGRLDGRSSAGGSGGEDPKKGALLMVPMVSSGESSSWQEGQGAQGAVGRSPVTSSHCTLQGTGPIPSRSPPSTHYLEFQGRPDGQAPAGTNQMRCEMGLGPEPGRTPPPPPVRPG